LKTGQEEIKSLNDLLNNRFDRLNCGRSSEPKPIEKKNLVFVFDTAEKRKKFLKKDLQLLKSEDPTVTYERL